MQTVVGMLQTSINGNQFQLKALVPTDTKNFQGGHISRVKGVGVSAIVDIKV